IDSVARMIPGVLGDQQSKENDSFYNGILDYPHYTRPFEFKGMKVPEILLSGNHQLVDKWREKKALKKTYTNRPDLLKNVNLTDLQKKLLLEIKDEVKGDQDYEQ
ncbi:MAG: tRNA (guanosine(37)-N1)-methyltransferase TrmD, partial [Halanaerobiales bacterium]|nr:tRNA (guanosine(37)-N1)-methyltransferase TrmD [Halanaerobiales bacterium]